MHLSPSSIRSWARLGVFVADSAASEGLPSARDTASSNLAEACVAAAEKHAMSSLLGKALGGVGTGGGSGHPTDATTAGFVAVELANNLSGQCKARLCGGNGGGGGAGGASTALKAATRGVHIHPGEAAAWRCVGAALVSAACFVPPGGLVMDVLQDRGIVLFCSWSESSRL